MRLEHSFTVPADIDTVWQAVLDPERVAPCMPGATLTEVNGSSFSGAVKVKLGPISLLYKGSGEFLETDEQAHRLVIKASGKDSRGAGTAAATVTVTLTAQGESTTGSVQTDLTVTGKPAQFGRGMISEVGGKILNSFASCLATKLAPEPEPAADTADRPAAEPKDRPAADSADRPAAEPKDRPAADSADRPAADAADRPGAEPKDRPAPPSAAARGPAEPEPEPIDLLAVAGPSALKRAAPLIAVLVAVLVVVAMRRRSR